MNNSIITIEVVSAEDDYLLDDQAMSLLFGVKLDAIRALPTVNGKARIPSMWVKRGRRRCREAMAHTGSDAMLDGLEYWARRDHNAELKVVFK